jgi:tetratricopeptide (TPR) repeat protein
MRLLGSILLCLLLNNLVVAINTSSEDSLFHYGALALSEQNYEVAIGLLTQEASNNPSFETFYNLSQAYAAQQEWNRAYYSAEQALKLAPNNVMAKENVRYTLFNLNPDISFQHPYSWLNRFVLMVPSLVWFILGVLVSLILAYFLFIAIGRVKPMNQLRYMVISLLTIALIGTYMAGIYSNHQKNNLHFALTLESNATTYASKDGIALNQVLVLGQRYSMLQETEDWVQLNYPDGQPVWVKKEFLLLY